MIGVYALSGFCSAVVGVLLASFSGQAGLGMGDDYLLPSIAAVVVGGSLITGGRGQYLGMLGGVLLLTALSTLLAGTMLPTRCATSCSASSCWAPCWRCATDARAGHSILIEGTRRDG